MNDLIPAGNFESLYTMQADNGEVVVIGDEIEFVIVDGTLGNEFTGRGHVDSDGLEMRLELRRNGSQLRGTWGEYDQDDQRVSGGELQFVADGANKFSGMWQMETPGKEGNPDVVSGTWMLTKAIGTSALK